MPGPFATGTLMLILCYSSLQGLCSLPTTRCFCRIIHDLVLHEPSASPRPPRRRPVCSEDIKPCTGVHSMPLPPCCPPGHLGPSQPCHADSQPSRDGQLVPSLPSCHPRHWALPPTAQVHLHRLSWRRRQEMPLALGLLISLAFCLTGRAAVLTNLDSPCSHHLTWQQQPKQLPNPATDMSTSHQHQSQPMVLTQPEMKALH